MYLFIVNHVALNLDSIYFDCNICEHIFNLYSIIIIYLKHPTIQFGIKKHWWISLALCISDDMSSNRHAALMCPIELLHNFTIGTLTSADDLTSCNITVDICTETSNILIKYEETCDNLSIKACEYI